MRLYELLTTDTGGSVLFSINAIVKERRLVDEDVANQSINQSTVQDNINRITTKQYYKAQ